MRNPGKGFRFFHSRVLDPSAMPERKPQLFVVTSITRGHVYYQSVHQRRDDTGNVYREDLGGKQCCPVSDFPKYCESAAPLSEADFIAREQAKLDARWLRMLRLAKNDPLAMSRHTTETLLVNGLVEFGGPSETCQYNHDRLTPAGLAKLVELETIA